jgi:galactonate dehydratase
MKITQVETVYCTSLNPQFVFVRVHTDAGLVGLGQTADYRTTQVIHDLAQRFFIGKDARHVEALWNASFRAAAYHGYSGAELRAISALDIALWDLVGQGAGLPIYELLGGPVYHSLPIYNTCSNYKEHNDRVLVREDPDRLVGELLEKGISCLKAAFFDDFAHGAAGGGATGAAGQRITPDGIAGGLKTIERVLRAGGGKMEVMVEMHGIWSLTAATEIARACRDLPAPGVHWLEDPIWQDNAESWADLRKQSPVRIAGSERLYTRHQMRRLLELHGTDVFIADITWAGGISEFKKMAAMAEAYDVPMAAHDHSGPVNLWASAHALLNAPNAYMMETTRVFYDTYYGDLVDGAPILKNGHIHLPEGPGLGIALRPSVLERPDAVVQRTTA